MLRRNNTIIILYFSGLWLHSCYDMVWSVRVIKFSLISWEWFPLIVCHLNDDSLFTFSKAPPQFPSPLFMVRATHIKQKAHCVAICLRPFTFPLLPPFCLPCPPFSFSILDPLVRPLFLLWLSLPVSPCLLTFLFFSFSFTFPLPPYSPPL